MRFVSVSMTIREVSRTIEDKSTLKNHVNGEKYNWFKATL